MPMHLVIAAVATRSRPGSFAGPLAEFAGRLAPYCAVEFPTYASEEALLRAVMRQKTRTPPLVVLLDSRGKGFSSEEFAGWLAGQRDGGRQAFFFAIGPASGWSPQARRKADLLLSLGPMTLPHELARVVVAEQLYRAFTIMAGHPYHLGH